jgi:hypothetical protein
MIRNLLLASCAVAALGFGTAARADVLLYSDSDSFTDQTTELLGSPVLTVDKYNGAGTVTSVVVTLTAMLKSEGVVTNNAAQSQSFGTETRVLQFDLTPGAGAPGVLASLQPFSVAQLIGSQNYVDLAPGVPAAFGPFSINGSDSDTYTGGDIAGFLGAGTFSMNPFTQILTSLIGGGGNIAFDIKTLASATLKVEYFGTRVIPEPSTFILTGLGLVGLGLARRVRKSA